MNMADSPPPPIPPQPNDADAAPPATGWWRGGGVLLLVALYAAAIYLPFLDGESRTLTSHEVLVTHPAMQVLESGDWVIPHRAGKFWVDKPPLATWITAALFAVGGGFSEQLARLPAAGSAILLCVLIAALAGRFFGPTTGLLAGLAQATAVYAYKQGRLGEPDMLFALLLAAAHVVLAWRWGRGTYTLTPLAALAFHVLVGLAVLAKGPLGIALPGMTVLFFCAFERSFRPLRAVLFTPAVIASIAIALSWHLAVVWRLGDDGLERLMYTYFARFAGMHHLGSHTMFLYFYTIPWFALPWTVVLALGARQLWRDVRRPEAALDRLLWAWVLGGLLVLTLSAFKHQHYCIPILPPLSILAARLLTEHAARVGRRAWHAYAGFFAGAAVVLLVVSGFVMPGRDHRRETVEFLRAAVQQVPPDEPLYVIGLAQSADYPYIEHDCVYLDTLSDLRNAFERDADGDIWVLTLQQYISAGKAAGFVFEPVAAERERRKRPLPETNVIGRIVAINPPEDEG